MILKGNLAPEGCVIKVAGHTSSTCIAGRRACSTARKRRWTRCSSKIKPGDVVVIRYEGPRGGPGMREMLGVTARDRRRGPRRQRGAGDRRALLGRDARLHGRARGARGGHGGPIARVREGDIIVSTRNAACSTWRSRARNWKSAEGVEGAAPRYTTG